MKWLKRKDVAAKLGVGYNYLRLSLEPREDFPQPVKLSTRTIVFEEGAIEKWMNEVGTAVVNTETLCAQEV